MVRIKICGITNLEDARKAVELGADALGFVFAPSPRRIEPEKAREIIRNLPPFITTVGVFVNERMAKVKEIAEFSMLDVLQFHGDEAPEYCRKFTRRVIKSFPVKDEKVLERLKFYSPSAYLLDAYSRSIRGGMGKTFPWEIARKAGQYGRIILAGGLNPNNVEEAIRTVCPYAVDVSSGVEISPGIKDHEKMAKFIRVVKRRRF